MHTFSPMHKWDTFSISCSGQKQKHHVFLFLMWGCFQDIRSLAFFHVCHIEMLQPSYLHHTVPPCCFTQTQVKIRNTTGNPLLTCISGGCTSKQKYGNFCFSCMYERGLCWHVHFSTHTHSNSTAFLQKSKYKFYSIECILSLQCINGILSPFQKQKHHVFLFLMLLGDLSNQGLPGVTKGSSKPSGAHLKHAPAGARYPAHVARARYESILAGWIPPEYRVPRQ